MSHRTGKRRKAQRSHSDHRGIFSSPRFRLKYSSISSCSLLYESSRRSCCSGENLGQRLSNGFCCVSCSVFGVVSLRPNFRTSSARFSGGCFRYTSILSRVFFQKSELVEVGCVMPSPLIIFPYLLCATLEIVVPPARKICRSGQSQYWTIIAA